MPNHPFHSMMRSILLLGLLLLACTACGPSQAEPQADAPTPPVYTITTQRDIDQITTSVGLDSVQVEIRSPSGIGSATVDSAAGAFPSRVAFRLYLAGLEEFTVTRSDGVILQLGVASSAPHTVWQSMSAATGESQALDPDDAEWATVSPIDDGFEILLDPTFSAEIGPTLTMRWIDFFR